MKISEITALRNEWYAIALVEGALEQPLRSIQLFGEEFVLFVSKSGEAVLLSPYCPHRGAHFANATPKGETFACCYHGWEFDVTGKCCAIPQLDAKSPIPPKARATTFPVVERYGLYWACIGEPVSDGPPPWHEADNLGWRVSVDFFEPWKVSALRIIDNNIDQTHPAFVHQNTFGNPAHAQIPRYDLEPTERGFRACIAHEVAGVGPQMGAEDESVAYERVTEVELLGPVQSRILLRYDGQAHDYCFYGSATPLDDEHSMYVRCSALSASEDVQPYGMFWDFSRRVTEEDRVVLETTRSDFFLDATTECHTLPDKTTLAYRRTIEKLQAAITVKEPANA